jgi:hypothetical protein
MSFSATLISSVGFGNGRMGALHDLRWIYFYSAFYAMDYGGVRPH